MRILVKLSCIIKWLYFYILVA